MNILALDLGTRTGWAAHADGLIFGGTWDLRTGRFEGGGMRFLRFRGLLAEAVAEMKPDMIAFEEVRRHVGTDAAHVYGGLLATLTAWCEERRLPYQGYPVGTIKKNWTGRGNASKEDMMIAAERRGFEPGNDNEADALAILHLAQRENAR